jgi:SynChlorMet cassette radical SAM/SPASM protein ScmE
MMDILSAPDLVTLILTRRCNILCKHCAVLYSSEPSKELSTERWIGIIEKLERAKVFKLHISGGEPFIRGNIFSIIEAIFKKPFRFSLNTNATLINDNIARRLSDFKKRNDYISVSIDGSNPEIHDRIRGEGSFKRMLNGVKCLINAENSVSGFTVVMRYNFNDLPNIVRLVRDLGMNGLKINNLIPEGEGLKNYLELMPTEEQKKRAFKMRDILIERFGNFVNGTFFDILEFWEEMEKDRKDEKGGSYFTGCGGGINCIAIMPDGTVTPCDLLPNIKVGNVIEEDFNNIWLNSPKLNEFRNRRDISLDIIKDCKECLYKKGCTGGCPAVPYSLHRNTLAIDPLQCYKVYKWKKNIPLPTYI